MLIATRRLVEEKGPDGFSISEACREAGVSTAAPYRHFADKRDMLIATAMDGMVRMRDGLRAEIEDLKPGTIDSIAALGRFYVAFAEGEPGLFRLMFGLTRDHGKNEEMMGCGRESFEVLIGEVASYFKRPPEDAEVNLVSFELWSSVHGLAFLLIDDKVDVVNMPAPIPDLIRDMTERIVTANR